MQLRTTIRSISIWKFGLLCSVFGALMAGALMGGWYYPWVFDHSWYTALLTTLAHVFWPTARIMGGGAYDRVTLWERATISIISNGVVYAFVGIVGFSVATVERVIYRENPFQISATTRRGGLTPAPSMPDRRRTCSQGRNAQRLIRVSSLGSYAEDEESTPVVAGGRNRDLLRVRPDLCPADGIPLRGL
jgi:hypothetical protein